MIKSKGGKGKAEAVRNKALVILNKVDPDTFNANVLGNLFNRHRKTISDILDNNRDKFSVGVINS